LLTTSIDSDWRVKEAALYALAAVSEYLENTEEEMAAIAKIIAISASIPFSPLPLGRSLIRFFGLYLLIAEHVPQIHVIHN
jgi:hypothetical protein